MLTAALSLVIAIVGLLVYAFANGKIAEVGRLAFAAGLLAALLSFPHVIHLP